MRAWTRRLLVALVLLLALGLLTIYLLGTAPLLRRLGAPPELQGALWHGLRAERLQGELPGLRWQAEGVELAPLRWRDGRLHSALQLRSLRLQFSAAEKPRPPLRAQELLAMLRWPTAVQLAPLQIDRLEIDGQRLEALRIERLQIGGPQPLLAIEGLSLREPQAAIRVQGSAQLAADGTLQAELRAQRQDFRLQTDARGTLDSIRLQLRLHEADAERLQGQAELAPLAAQPLRVFMARFQSLDPQRLHPQAPQGLWDGELRLQPLATARLQLEGQARNRAARRFDEQGWPLRSLSLRLALDPAQWQALQLQALALELGGADRAAGRIELDTGPGQALPRAGVALHSRIHLKGVLPQQLDKGWPQATLNGELDLRQAQLALNAPLSWQLRLQALIAREAEPWRLQAAGTLLGRRLQVAQAALQRQEAGVRLQGEAELLPGNAWRSQGKAEIARLALRLPPWSAVSRLDTQLDWQLQRDAAGRHLGELQLRLQEGNQLAGLPLRGEARWRADTEGADWRLQLEAGDLNRIEASGRQSGALRDPRSLAAAERWLPQQATWQLPQLELLRPLWQPWLTQLAGRSEGEWRWPAGEKPAARLALAELRLQTRADAQPLRLQSLQAAVRDDQGSLALSTASQGAWTVERLQASGGLASPWLLEGQLSQLPAGRPVDETRRWRLKAGSAAAQFDAGQWRWPALQLSLSSDQADAPPLLQLADASLLWQLAERRLQLQAGRLSLAGENLNLLQANWQANGPWQLVLQGNPRLAPWLAAVDRDSGWRGEARAQLRLAASQQRSERPRVNLELGGLQGELQLEGRPLGLQALQLSLQQQPDGSAQLALALASSLLGEVDLRLSQTAQAALAGSARARLPRLQALRPWLPGGLQLEGQAQLDALIGGTLQSPRLRGTAALQLDRLLHPDSGLAAQAGVLRAEFSEASLLLRELQLQGQGEKGGSLSGSGQLSWAGEEPRAQLQLQAAAFRVLNRFDRRLVLSGQAQLELLPRLLKLKGQLSADEGVFEIGRPDAPQLDDDVIVVRADEPPAKASKKASPWQREVDLRFDLGQRLRVQGRGFASRLTGELRLQQAGGKPLSTTGRIETQGGRYKAYGQTLDLESGELRFTGSLENPRLDLLAIKPDIEHRVGVAVTGTAQSPRVRLFAEPELPDNDKLAWLLLGRDPAEISGRDTAILQRAALALLAGEADDNPASQLMDRLGLTEFSLSQGEDAGTVLRLGARLGRRWTVGYERSLNATSGSWQLIYRIGQRFRLRAQSGLDSAIDLLWLWRYD